MYMLPAFLLMMLTQWYVNLCMKKFLFAVLLMLGIVVGFSIGYRGFAF